MTLIHYSAVAAILFSLTPVAILLPAQSRDLPAPVELTREQDHRRTMDLLGIKSLRRGANGRDQTAPNAANYNESTATPYPHLPDPLLTNGREEVTTPEMWWGLRRPEIVKRLTVRSTVESPRTCPRSIGKSRRRPMR